MPTSSSGPSASSPSVLLVGACLGSAFHLFFANRSGSVATQAGVRRQVVQPLSGIVLAQMASWPLTSPWLAVYLALYLLADTCWLPVVAIQIRIARMAQAAHAAGPRCPHSTRACSAGGKAWTPPHSSPWPRSLR